MLSRQNYESLPSKRMGSGALVLKDGKALLVEPTYKNSFEIPGGIVEVDESPREALKREIREELGLDISPGRLLLIEYQTGDDIKTESLMFIFEVRLTTDHESKISLCKKELRSWQYVCPQNWEQKLVPPLAKRLSLASEALRNGTTMYVEDGMLR